MQMRKIDGTEMCFGGKDVEDGKIRGREYEVKARVAGSW